MDDHYQQLVSRFSGDGLHFKHEMFTLILNKQGLPDFKADLRQGMASGLRAATKRGVEIMKQEVPEDTGRLKEGVKPHVDVNAMRGEIEVCAIRPAQPARIETVVLASGRTKEIKFGAQREYDYAKAVWGGTGIYGARGVEIKPKKAKKLRFVIGARTVFAGSVEGQEPNPFHDRTGDRLEPEAESLIGREVEREVNR